MLSNEIYKLERENATLKKVLSDLSEKMKNNATLKPRSCQYCKNYVQHYAKDLPGSTRQFAPIYAGHCASGVPISKGGKRKPYPDDTCPYFELEVCKEKDYM